MVPGPIVNIIIEYGAHQKLKGGIERRINARLQYIAKTPTSITDKGIQRITARLTTLDKASLELFERAMKALDNRIRVSYDVVSGEWSREDS